MNANVMRSRPVRAMHLIGALMVAIAVTATIGSIIQTQVNLAALTSLGAAVPINVRAQTTLNDLIGFAPTWAAIVGAGFVIAFAVVAWLSRWWPAQRRLMFVLAGALAITTALWLMKLSLGLTAIAAARTSTGVILLSICGAVGGWVFWRCRAASIR